MLVVLAEPVLVGREKELTELQTNLNSVLNGSGTTIFISGETGSGKTRIIQEFLNTVKNREINILYGWCLSKAPIPFFPFIEAFTSNLSSGEETGTISRQYVGMKSWLLEPIQVENLEKKTLRTPQIWKDQTFATITKELLFMSSVKPLILILEDMHWSDSASLALLHYISRSIVSEKILIIVSFRSEELRSDSEGHPHPLVDTVHLMGREGLFKEIKLTRLNPESIEKIAESMLKGKVDPKLVEKLALQSQGNPLFIVEFLRMLSEKRKLVRKHNQWRISAEHLGMPPKVKEIILRRIGSLTPHERRILDIASVIGYKFNPDLIAYVFSKDRLVIFESLNRILKNTSLVKVEGNFFSFDHEKSRDVIYEEISSPLKKVYHAKIAEKIEKSSENGKEVVHADLFYHYSQSGNIKKSVEYAIISGKDALARFSNKEAIDHFRYVLKSIANLDEYDTQRKVALEGLGDAYFVNCMFEEAVKTFENLASSESGNIRLRAYRKEMDAIWCRDIDSTRLMQLIKKAEKYVGSDRLEKARILWNRGRGFVKSGNLKAALRDHKKALQIFEEEYSLSDLAQILAGTGITRIMYGTDCKKGLSELLRSIVIYRELGDVRGEIMATVLRNSGYQLCGLYKELDGAYNNILKLSEKIGDFENFALASLHEGGILEYHPPRRFKDAIAQSLKALEYSKKTDAKRLQSQIYTALTRQYAKIGDLENADYYFNKLKNLSPETTPMQEYIGVQTKAIYYTAKNDWKEANQHFQKLLEFLEKGYFNQISYKALYRVNYIWALEFEGCRQEAKKQKSEMQKILRKVEKTFSQVSLHANLMMQKEVIIDQESEMRLDMVNVSRNLCSVIMVENLIPSEGINITVLPSYCQLQDNSLKISKGDVNPFQVRTLRFSFLATKPGVFSFKPRIVFIDNFGDRKTCELKPIYVTIKPMISIPNEKKVIETKTTKIEFKSVATQKAFDFLVKAYEEDYFRKSLLREQSGWRTLMDIIKGAKVSRHSIYGSSGHRGQAIVELKNLSVVETRFFSGERGRGGKIMKLRACYEKENIKQYIYQPT